MTSVPDVTAVPRQKATARSTIRSWSLQSRVARASIAVAVVLAALFSLVVFSMLRFKDRGDEVINRWLPASTLSQNLLADLVNQETGIRGYALGHDEVFLAPYRNYLLAERRDEQRLAGYIAGRADLEARFADFRRAAEDWRARIAVPFIQRVRSGDTTVADAATSARARAAFDRIRVSSAALSSDLERISNDVRGQRSRAATFLIIVLSVFAAVTLLAGLVAWRGLRRSVLQPVEDLAAQTRDVADGAIDRKIVPSGPPEIAALGRDVDTMRAQIASELERVEQARAVLAQRSEDLARSNADLEQFAYVASHDLSEPLRKVANFCQLLERQYGPQLDDKAKQYIDFAVDGAKRMQVLIGDLLSFSRVGRTTETFERVDLNTVLARALANLDDRIESSHAEIVHDPLPTISGDATLLTALLQNMVGNALKYSSPDRTPHVEIHAEQRADDWLFTVQDNGIGIDPQYAERIFTIFQRLHLRDQYGGTGIGLALCRKIVEFHRGTIWLAETDGPGATFHFTLPAQLPVGLDPRDMGDL